MKKWIIAAVLLTVSTAVLAGDVCKIGFMLEMQKKLNLSEKQVAEITGLHKAMKKFHINQEAKQKLEEVELKELMGNKAKNLKKIKAQMDKMALLDAETKFKKLETELKAYNLLDSEQKTAFGKYMEKWHHEQMLKDKEKNIKIHIGEGKEGHDTMIWKHKGGEGEAEFIGEDGKKHVIIKRMGEDGEVMMDVHKEIIEKHKGECECEEGEEGKCENCTTHDVKVIKKVHEGEMGHKVVIEREINKDGKVTREKKEYDIEALIKENKELKAALEAEKAKKK
jgi:Spy/CpxP family protein refolding chaperone